MPTLAPSWQTCRVVGIWLTNDLTALRQGTYKVTYPRARNIKQRATVPSGTFASGNLNVTPGTPPATDTAPIVNPSLDITIPSTTDPDTRDAMQVVLVINFTDGAASETYTFDAPSGGTVYLDDLEPVIGSAAANTASSLKLGQAGGAALLNSSGQVVDASGTPVSGGVSAWSDLTGDLPIGQATPGMPIIVYWATTGWRTLGGSADLTARPGGRTDIPVIAVGAPAAQADASWMIAGTDLRLDAA